MHSGVAFRCPLLRTMRWLSIALSLNNALLYSIYDNNNKNKKSNRNKNNEWLGIPCARQAYTMRAPRPFHKPRNIGPAASGQDLSGTAVNKVVRSWRGGTSKTVMSHTSQAYKPAELNPGTTQVLTQTRSVFASKLLVQHLAVWKETSQLVPRPARIFLGGRRDQTAAMQVECTNLVVRTSGVLTSLNTVQGNNQAP